MQFMAALVANILQRAFGSKPNTFLTITGILAALSAGASQLPVSVLPPKYQPWLVGAAAFLAALVGILGHGQNAALQDSKEQAQPLQLAGK